MERPYNFSAGPAAIPPEVLQQAAAEMLDWHGSGMSVMEMSHRGKEFISIYEQAEASLRELLAVPANFRILFMQGGGLGENAIVPMNLSARRGGRHRGDRQLEPEIAQGSGQVLQPGQYRCQQ
jgi:phosphoserine aminotransferase